MAPRNKQNKLISALKWFPLFCAGIFATHGMFYTVCIIAIMSDFRQTHDFASNISQNHFQLIALPAMAIANIIDGEKTRKQLNWLHGELIRIEKKLSGLHGDAV